MKCPRCALYHPAQYSECVACGTFLEQENEPAAPKRKIFGVGMPAAPVKAPAKPAEKEAKAERPKWSFNNKKFDRQSQLEETKRKAEELAEVVVPGAEESSDAMELEARKLDTQKQLEATKVRSEQLEERNSVTEKALEAKRMQAQQLEAQTAETQKQLDDKKLEAERLDSQRLEAHKQLVESKAETEELEAKKLSAQIEIEVQKAELEKLQVAKIEVARLQDQKEQIERLEAERAETQRLLDAKRSETEKIDGERIEKERQLEARRLETEELERIRIESLKELDATREQAQQLVAQKQETERELDARRAESAKLEALKREAQQQLEWQRAEAEQLEAQKRQAMAELNEQKRRATAELAAQRLEAEKFLGLQLEAQRLLELQKAEAERLEARTQEVEKELEAKKLASDRFETQRDTQNKQLAEARAQAREQLEAQRREAEQLELQRAEAQKQIEEQRKEVLRLQREQAEREAARNIAEKAEQEAQKLNALQVEQDRQKLIAEQKVLAAQTEQERQKLIAEHKQLSEHMEQERQKLLEAQAWTQKEHQKILAAQAEQDRQAQQLQERMRVEAKRQFQAEKSRSHERSYVDGRRELEAQLQPAGQIHVATQDPHETRASSDKRRHGRDPIDPRDPQQRSENQNEPSDKSRGQAGYDAKELEGLQRSYWGGGGAGAQEPTDSGGDSDDDDDMENDPVTGRPRPKKRRSKTNPPRKRGVPAPIGIVLFVAILLVSTGATVFFLTKPPDDQRLYLQGIEEIKKGEYAFAVNHLTDAVAMRPKDARVYLALARAYVGVDQVDKAWQCVSEAQQLGAGVAEEPALASDLAKYYRQKGEFEKAINLLRPLAKLEADGKKELSGKKAELADLDAMWGDEALREGKLDLALRCWEEVRDLNDGSRATEAQTRLATIYQKLANTLAGDADTKNDGDALKYLSKLNNIAENPKNLEMAADLYEKTGQLELAIDQLRKAEKMNRNPVMQRKLAALLTRRGKELLDEGNTDQGYAYLQQAKSVSPANSLPVVALRDLNVAFDQSSYTPKITGRVWNPTDKSINGLTLKVELFDTANSKVLWSKDQRIIDEFVPPLGAQESKNFEFVAGVPAKSGASEFRVYLDGTLYKTYPIGKKEKAPDATDTANDSEQRTILVPPRAPERSAPPPAAVKPVQQPQPQAEAPPVPGLNPTPTPEPAGRTSAEERTMKDLDQ